MRRRVVNIGDRFGRWTIQGEAEVEIVDGYHFRRLRVKCDCGNEKVVRAKSLFKGSSISCGCFRIENVVERSTKHGLYKHTLYSVFDGMKRRCSDPKTNHYKYYGGKGVRVCEEWKSDFMSFYNWAMANGWQKGLQIDRIDNDGNYEPSNCQFVDCKTNNRKRDIVILSEEKAAEIRAFREKTNWALKRIAQYFNLNRTTVSAVIHNYNWKQ